MARVTPADVIAVYLDLAKAWSGDKRAAISGVTRSKADLNHATAVDMSADLARLSAMQAQIKKICLMRPIRLGAS